MKVRTQWNLLAGLFFGLPAIGLVGSWIVLLFMVVPENQGSLEYAYSMFNFAISKECEHRTFFISSLFSIGILVPIAASYFIQHSLNELIQKRRMVLSILLALLIFIVLKRYAVELCAGVICAYISAKST